MNQLNQFDSLAENDKRTWREKHDAYLKSDHWRDLRLRCFAESKHCCEACGSRKRLEGHHLIYRDPIESGKLDDIMALCHRCHEVWHAYLRQDRKQLSDFKRSSTRGLIRLFVMDDLPKERRARAKQDKTAKKKAKQKEKYIQRAAIRKERAEKCSVLPAAGMSAHEINATHVQYGGFTRLCLRAMGVSWPPPRGWRKQLIANYKGAANAPEYFI